MPEHVSPSTLGIGGAHSLLPLRGRELVRFGRCAERITGRRTWRPQMAVRTGSFGKKRRMLC